MNQQAVCERLFVIFATGGTFEECLQRLPSFRPQIETAFQWMKSNAQSRSSDIGQLAQRYREAIRAKDAAIRSTDIPKAAKMRSEEYAITERLGMKPPGSWAWTAILEVGVEGQVQELSALLRETAMGSESGRRGDSPHRR
jgi:hypothetical protein